MKTILRLTALVSVFVATLCFVSCLIDNETGVSGNHGLVMTFGADAITDAQVIQDMRLFTFYREATANQNKFRKEIYNISREGGKISASVETGLWYLGMLSAPAGTVIIPPSPTLTMQSAPMYEYTPTIVSGKSSDAAEIYYTNMAIPEIVENIPKTAEADIARNVAKVELVIVKASKTFKTTSDAIHTIKLHNVPSKISYTGALLPNKDTPDVVAPLEAKLQFTDNISDASYLESNAVQFIIPAHQGTDFLTAINPKDTTTLKMQVSVELERVNGTKFTKIKEIPIVALCNRILQVTITVDDGIEFGTKLLPWNKVAVNELVGEGYSNWLYVKKDATGNGQSWTDALPTINDAISKVAALKAAGYTTFHGILVAGGSDKAYTEAEGIVIPAGVRIFGGWEGVSGTELSATDANGPYTSAKRDLSKFKTYLSITKNGVSLPYAGSVLDGFRLTGVGPVAVSNSAASMNAVEMHGMSVASGDVFSMTTGTATNILITGSNNSMSLSGSAKLINATITDNGGLLTATGGASLLNSIVWWGTKTGGGYSFTGSTIQYCAIQGDNGSNQIPTGTGNVPINATNTAWFTTGVNGNIPGPHFNQNGNTSLPYYAAAGNKSPMVGRADSTLFIANIPVAITPGFRKDINGKPRTVAIGSEKWTDIGCYQEGTFTGFKLRWASDRIYISSKNGYITDAPLLLPDNGTTQIGLSWTVTRQGTLNYCTMIGDPTISGNSGSDFILVGSFKLQTSGDYTANAERKCGTVRISTNLGAYLADVDVEVWQTPGQSSVWDTGYVGSFHKNNETSERYITGSNSGTYTVRIIAGLDWIKIDGNNKGAYGGEVQEVFGGTVTGTGNIKFRVGMKSTLAADSAPRYGLIVIQRSGGVAMFFVRQGEAADYLYGPTDPRNGGRTSAKKFSPYNLRDPQDGTPNEGISLGANGATWVTHPTKIGYFFQWNRTTAYLRGAQTSSLLGGFESSYEISREVCPAGYRHGTYQEWVESCYLNVPFPGNTLGVSPTGSDVLANFVWGRYADGYYDQIAPDPVSSTTDAVGSYPNVAMKGVLMVNHYNYAAVFFPAAGIMPQTSPGTVGNSTYAMYHTSTYVGATGRVHNTHWVGGSSPHVGMSCTQIHSTSTTAGNGSGISSSNTYPHAGVVRCVKE